LDQQQWRQCDDSRGEKLLHKKLAVLHGGVIMQRFRAKILFLAAMGNLVFSANARAISNSDLTITINGLKNPRGQVCLSLFSNSQGFPGDRERALQAQCFKAAQTPLVVNFRNLKTGNYAAAVIHDANSDRTLNCNALGIPVEGFGFSRNPKIRMGPPKFGDAAILVKGPSTNVQIQLQYLLGS
jgi:uncharacterized protein (DUF2141 family)